MITLIGIQTTMHPNTIEDPASVFPQTAASLAEIVVRKAFFNLMNV